MAIERINGELFVDGISAVEIAKRSQCTPFYLYSVDTLKKVLAAWVNAKQDTDVILNYSVKANNNLYLNRIISSFGLGATVVSLGEIELAKRAGYDMRVSLLHGTAKSEEEVSRAIEHGMMVSVDSLFDAQMIAQVADKLAILTRVLLRINPEIDANVHPYLATSMAESKFGLSEDDVWQAVSCLQGVEEISICGLHCHLGSTLASLQPLEDALNQLLKVAQKMQAEGINVQIINLGGGMGVNYMRDEPKYPTPEEVINTLARKLEPTSFRLMLEPGRAIVATCGLLISKVVGLKSNKSKNFIIVDASMTELIRPPLYQAYHHIEPVKVQAGLIDTYDIVGPVCESADFLGLNRTIEKLSAGELIAIFDTGAYGYTMSSEYNMRPKPAEIIVDSGKVILTRRRGSLENLFSSFTEEVLS